MIAVLCPGTNLPRNTLLAIDSIRATWGICAIDVNHDLGTLRPEPQHAVCLVAKVRSTLLLGSTVVESAAQQLCSMMEQPPAPNYDDATTTKADLSNSQ